VTPYYEDSDAGIVIYHGDCREVLPGLSLQADMVFADPPYGETQLPWDRWPDRWIASLGTVVTRSTNFWCFGSMRMFLEHAADFVFWRFVQDVVWEKHNGSGFLVDRFRRVHETVAHFVPVGCEWSSIYKSPQFTADAVARQVRKKAKPAHWHGATAATTYESIDGGPRMMRSVQYVRSMHGKAIHSTQKPVGLLGPILDYSCPVGGLVVDPFCGSGSTAEACKHTGRRCVSIEADEANCERAANRLRQGVLFAADAEG
jgi:site-specific DNA-methyltransferase (adenine-specific)